MEELQLNQTIYLLSEESRNYLAQINRRAMKTIAQDALLAACLYESWRSIKL